MTKGQRAGAQEGELWRSEGVLDSQLEPRQTHSLTREPLTTAGHDASTVPVPVGEAAKNLDVARRCWDSLGDKGFARDDVSVGFTDGAVTETGPASWPPRGCAGCG